MYGIGPGACGQLVPDCRRVVSVTSSIYERIDDDLRAGSNLIVEVDESEVTVLLQE
jgi:hypothetical protein